MLQLIIAANVAAQSKPDSSFHIYILVGQSNMAGRGPMTDALKAEEDPRVLMLNKSNEWVLAKHPMHFDKPGIVGVGPGFSFGIKMAKANKKVRIGLVPCAVGGSPIDHWLPGAYDAATKTHPYDDAVIRIKEAMKAGIIKGIIWHQGESDSEPEMAKGYLDKLTELIGRMRNLIGNPNIPFIAGELGTYRPVYANINQVIVELPQKVPYTAVVSSEGLADKGDTIHFDGPSAEELGKRYAVKMLQVQKQLKKRK